MGKASLQNVLCAVTAFLVITSMLVGIVAASDSEALPTDASPELTPFHGAWFAVSYPADFSVKPSLKSNSAEGYDSAEFTSPDGTVSFYIFAPQWGGIASDILVIPERERVVDEQRRQLDEQEIRWFTIAAKDGSYRRSYKETTAQQGSIKTIIGITYKSEEARLRYLKAYELFKKSLTLYAD